MKDLKHYKLNVGNKRISKHKSLELATKKAKELKGSYKILFSAKGW